MTLTIGSLFSGIGGLELGLEWAGLGPTIWQVEKDPACREVLARHWPGTELYDDAITFCTEPHAVDCDLDEDYQCGANAPMRPDVLCGGFPCQDVSAAGGRRGLEGAKSGLWREMARVVRNLRPRWVVVENVADLSVRGFDRVLGDLAEGGYDAVWFPLRASDVGAPHQRARVFIVAHRDGWGRLGVSPARLHDRGARGDDSDRCGCFPPGRGDADAWAALEESGHPPPGLRRVADGFPAATRQQLRQLGNAVVPQCAEVVGRLILEMEQAV